MQGVVLIFPKGERERERDTCLANSGWLVTKKLDAKLYFVFLSSSSFVVSLLRISSGSVCECVNVCHSWIHISPWPITLTLHIPQICLFVLHSNIQFNSFCSFSLCSVSGFIRFLEPWYLRFLIPGGRIKCHTTKGVAFYSTTLYFWV